MKIALTRFIFSLLLFSSSLLCLWGLGTEPFSLIQDGNLPELKSFFKENDVNGFYGEKKMTPLAYAIQVNQYKVVKLLVKLGADVNQKSANLTPLIFTVEGTKLKIARYLLKKGASVNDTTPTGNTAIIYAAVQGTVTMAKFLVDNNIDFNKNNQAGNTALDYANDFNNRPVGDYLRTLNARSKASFYPNYLDGPHLVWTGQNEAIQFYMKRDSAKDKVITKTKTLFINESPFIFQGLDEDTATYLVIKETKRPIEKFENVSKVLAIGDVHGGYDSLVHFLQVNDVIDEQLNWSWNNGHLVFLGDIFDRGEKVTECLWLIYKLEHQADKYGGKVHYILGNHELLILESSLDDVAEKYRYMTNYLNISYPDFFAPDTEFGKWLRTRNIAIKINDKIYIHGGISPEFMDMDIGLEEMNRLISDFLSERVDTVNLEKTKFLLGEYGPFWYRGYITPHSSYDRISESDLDDILDYFGVSSIVVGHTNVRDIKGLYNKKILATDIPFYLPNFEFQGLLIEDDMFYVLNSSGNRNLLR
jgi:hypothetical protein